MSFWLGVAVGVGGTIAGFALFLWYGDRKDWWCP